MKKIKIYIKNYKNNSLPETLFLIGVFILSVGLFIEPKTSWFLGIHFYKSDLNTITTISKILGTFIISSSIILNLKKYTNRGGNKLNEHSKLLEGEEKKEKVNEEIKIDIIKTEAYLKNTGGFIHAVGWLTLIINLVIYVWNKYDGEIVLNSVFVIIFAITSLYIILGKRIKNLNDIKTKLYLNIIAFSSIIFGFVVVYSGGRIGLLFFFLIGYLLVSLNKIHKAMRVEEFHSKLSKQKYQINKNEWVVLFIAFSVLLTFFIIRDIKVIDSYTSIDSEQEYQKNKPDLSYDAYLREKNVQETIGAWDVFGNQKKDANNTSTQVNIINNELCKKDNSNSVWSGKIGADGKVICEIIESDKAKEIIKNTPLTGAQICARDFPNTTWDGKSYNDAGGYSCS